MRSKSKCVLPASISAILCIPLVLFSDEAVENGFAGASLGLEFAGIVLRTGNGSKGFSPGDRVVGFGPSCFANRVATKATAHFTYSAQFIL